MSTRRFAVVSDKNRQWVFRPAEARDAAIISERIWSQWAGFARAYGLLSMEDVKCYMETVAANAEDFAARQVDERERSGKNSAARTQQGGDLVNEDRRGPVEEQNHISVTDGASSSTYRSREEVLSLLPLFFVVAEVSVSDAGGQDNEQDTMEKVNNQDQKIVAHIGLDDGDLPAGERNAAGEYSVDLQFRPWLTDLYVVPEYRNKGVATFLVSNVLRFYEREIINMRIQQSQPEDLPAGGESRTSTTCDLAGWPWLSLWSHMEETWLREWYSKKFGFRYEDEVSYTTETADGNVLTHISSIARKDFLPLVEEKR
ncbi:unnamed protein product [Amoebophrya sp. A120]|nr:unnamed protein product [Amoebophrya sp. A120]|eukprot:GSA120T00016938001.1